MLFFPEFKYKKHPSICVSMGSCGIWKLKHLQPKSLREPNPWIIWWLTWSFPKYRNAPHFIKLLSASAQENMWSEWADMKESAVNRTAIKSHLIPCRSPCLEPHSFMNKIIKKCLSPLKRGSFFLCGSDPHHRCTRPVQWGQRQNHASRKPSPAGRGPMSNWKGRGTERFQLFLFWFPQKESTL